MRKSALTTFCFALLAMLLMAGCSTLGAVGALLGNGTVVVRLGN